MKYSLFDWCINQSTWKIYCPKCNNLINFKKDKSCFTLNNTKVDAAHLRCNTCDFEIDIDWLWYKVSTNETVKKLQSKVQNISYDKAWQWVNNYKYTNPTFKLCQNEEREKSQAEILQILNNNLPKKSAEFNGNVLFLGCNNNEEVFVFNHFNLKNIVCVDISKSILENAYLENHCALTKMLANNEVDVEHDFKIHYCEGFVDKLPKVLNCYKIENNNFTTTYPFTEKFELAFIFKVLQSSYFDKKTLIKSLKNIAKHLVCGATLLISLPKATVFIKENTTLTSLTKHPQNVIDFVAGIYDGEKSVNCIDKVNQIVAEIEKTKLYNNITIHKGTQNSYEYFISCTKK